MTSFDQPTNSKMKVIPPVCLPSVATPTQVTPTSSLSTPQSINAKKTPRNSFSTISTHLPNLLTLPGLHGLGNLLDQLVKAPNQLQVLAGMLNLPPNQVQLLEMLMHQHQQQLQSKVLESSRVDWLVRSLQSGFPNEIDFALNSLLIVSSDNKGVLPLGKVPHLVNVLLAHVGVFSKGMCSWLHNFK